MRDLYLGMISGTSVDGVDAVLVDFGQGACEIVAAETSEYPTHLRDLVSQLIVSPQVSLAELGTLDSRVGDHFAKAALNLLTRAGIEPTAVRAIGHHGQTIFHEPNGEHPFTLQIGDPNVVAARTGISTVADFRRLDMAHGGQGAPLVPAFHAWLLSDPTESRVILNIGGIANITLLTPKRKTIGFDTGPGNTLLDLWVANRTGRAFDAAGSWAASGQVNEKLLNALLAEPYFDAAPPKSTGRELFNAEWLEQRLARFPSSASLEPCDVQATLAELTAQTITHAVKRHAPNAARIIACGGGVHNRDLMERLARCVGNVIETTADYGIEPDWVEAAAFAWLARARINEEPSNVPSVTGARATVSLGGVYSGSRINKSIKFL